MKVGSGLDNQKDPDPQHWRPYLLYCQASSLAFLSRHGFDFNRWVGEGLGYLSQQQEAELRREAERGTLFDRVARGLAHTESDRLMQLCSQEGYFFKNYFFHSPEAPVGVCKSPTVPVPPRLAKKYSHWIIAYYTVHCY